MTSDLQKTPGSADPDETFYSLAPARSQPNLSSAHLQPVVATDGFDTPASKGGGSDQLIGLPGYRRSTIHSQRESRNWEDRRGLVNVGVAILMSLSTPAPSSSRNLLRGCGERA